MQVCMWAVAIFKLGCCTWSGTISVNNRSLQLKQGCGLQELLRPDARSWGDWDRGTSYCLSPAAGGIHIVHMYMCTDVYFTHMDLPPDQPERGTGQSPRDCLCFKVLTVSICADKHVQLSVYVLCTCVCVCVPTGDPRSASMLLGQGGTELHQPCLWKAPGFQT